MNTPTLHILLIEDSEDDTLLILRQIEEGGYKLKWKRVDTANAMEIALQEQPWDIILADYKLPVFGGLEALEILNQLKLDIPFIIVSGTIGEDIAVKAMKAGAHDYIMKDKLIRLMPAIERELREAKTRKKRKEAEDALAISEAFTRRLVESSPIGILYLDTKGIITFENKAMKRSLHFQNIEYTSVIGKYIFDLPIFIKSDLSRDFHKVMTGEIIQGKIIHYVNKTNNKIHLEIYTAPISNEQDEIIGIILMANNITERYNAEEAIKKSLEEKQILLKEIHHRVKNNLQIISSLFNLQSNYIKNKQALDILKQSQIRVRSMALIHEILYQSKDFARIDLKQYIRKLIHELFVAYRININRISSHLKIDDIFISIDKAIPCGLIINELVSNALKYAFPSDFRKKGKIHIELYQKSPTGIELIVSDNGVGMPEAFNMAESKSLGLYLVNILTQDQLGGKIELIRNNGTKFNIFFPKLIR